MDRFASAKTRFDGFLRWLRSPANAVSALLLGVVFAVAGEHAWSFHDFYIDDAYITFRYADNLAHGLGFVFNPGEHVEGTSTFLETIVLAVLRLFGAELLLASRVLGVGSFFALIVGAFVLVRSLAASYGRTLGIGAAVLVASSMPLAVYAMSGLETNLFAALLLVGSRFICAQPALPWPTQRLGRSRWGPSRSRVPRGWATSGYSGAAPSSVTRFSTCPGRIAVDDSGEPI